MSTSLQENPQEWNGVTKDTQFTKLPKNIASRMEQFEFVFELRLKMSDIFNRKMKKEMKARASEIDKDSIATDLEKVAETTSELLRRVSSVQHNIQKEKEVDEVIKEDVKEELENAEMAQSNLSKLISTHYYTDKNYTSKYFERVARKLESRMQEIWREIEEVSNVLIERGNEQRPGIGINKIFDFNLLVLQETLKAQQEAFLNLSANFANLHEIANNLRELFISKYVQKEGQDPFRETEEKKFVPPKPTTTVTLPGLVETQPQQQTQQAQTIGFNLGSTQPSTGFSFGNTGGSFSFNTGSNTGFSFGDTSSNTGFSFGNTTSNTGSGFSFGTSNTSGGFSFGNTSSNTSGGFSFGDTSSNTGFSFGNTSSNTGGGFSFGTPTFKF